MPNFEALKEPEWIGSANNSKTDEQQRPLFVPYFDFDRDNEARAAWRQGDIEPEHISRSASVIIRRWYELPEDFDPQAQLPDANMMKGRWNLTPMIPELEDIGMKTDSHLIYKPKRRKSKAEVEIWCRLGQLYTIRKALNEWINPGALGSAKPKRTLWAKIYSLSPITKKEMTKQLQDDEIRQGFRRQPPPDFIPVALGYFEWPADIVKATDVLGKNCEALDPIRMDHYCYIKWIPEQSLFEVMGEKRENVERAVDRVRATFFQVIARQIVPRPRYFVHPMSAPALARKSCVQLVQFGSNKGDVRAPHKMVPQLELGKASLLSLAVDTESMELESNPVILRLQNSVSCALEKLPYYAGNLTMRVRLGQFVLTRYWPQNQCSLEEFEKLLSNERARGYVTRENGERMKWSRQRKLFKTILNHPDVMVPLNDTAALGIDIPAKLHLRQRVNAIFVLQLRKEPGYFRVEVEFNRSPESQLERTAHRISKVDQEDGQLNKVADISLIDLERKTSAWNFEITGGNTIDITRFPQLDKWVSEHIIERNDALVATHDPKADFLADHRFFSCKSMPGISVVSIQQQSFYFYAIPETEYLCEVSLNEEFANTATNRQITPEGDFVPMQRWISVSVFHNVWDVQFAENAGISVGERVKWDADLGRFFPLSPGSGSCTGKAHPGFANFLRALDTIQNLIYPSRRTE